MQLSMSLTLRPGAIDRVIDVGGNCASSGSESIHRLMPLVIGHARVTTPDRRSPASVLPR